MHTFHKRRHPRRAAGTKACIYAGRDMIPCTVVDVSEHGARLRLAAATPLPGRFSLLVSAAEPMQNCERIWQDGDLTGLRFV